MEMGKHKKKHKPKPKNAKNTGKKKEKRNKPNEPDHQRGTKRKNKRELKNEPEGEEDWESELLDHYTNVESTFLDILPPADFQESESKDSVTALNVAAAPINQELPKLTEDTTKIVEGQATASSNETQSRQVNMKIGYYNTL